MQKRVFIITLFSFFLFQMIICQTVKDSLSESNKGIENVYFFVIDLSGSMTVNKLDEKVKSELKKFIRDEIKINERIVLIGFGDKVTYYADQVINSTEDIERIYGTINNFSFRQSWTHMSSAFDHLATRLKEISGNKFIYIFTDGVNDPPAHLNEKPEVFDNILKMHFNKETLTSLKSYIYYISLGIKPPEIIENLSLNTEQFKVTEVMVKDSKESIIPFILNLKLLQKDMILLKNKKNEFELKFEVVSISRSSSINVFYGENKQKLDLNKESKDLIIPVTPSDLTEGEHDLVISFEPSEENSKITPDTFTTRYKVIVPDKRLQYLAILLILCALIAIVIYLLLPSFKGNLTITREANFERKLSGKCGKRLCDLFKGYGLSSTIKVYPDSLSSQVKIRFNKNDKILLDGIECNKSPFNLRVGQEMQINDAIIKYDK